MSKLYTPNPEFMGDDENAIRRLDEKIKQVTETDEKLAFEYELESLQLKLAGMVQNVRMQSGLTQKQFAEKVGVSQPFIARIENPIAEKEPSLQTIAKIAYALNKRVIIQLADISS